MAFQKWVCLVCKLPIPGIFLTTEGGGGGGGGGWGEGGSSKLHDEQVGKRDQNLTFYSVISCAKVQQGY